MCLFKLGVSGMGSSRFVCWWLSSWHCRGPWAMLLQHPDGNSIGGKFGCALFGSFSSRSGSSPDFPHFELLPRADKFMPV